MIYRVIKITFTQQHLRTFINALEMYALQYPALQAREDLDIFRLCEMHRLYFEIKKRLVEMERKKKSSTLMSWSVPALLTAHHVLESLQYCSDFQHLLNDLNRIKVSTLPITINNDEILF
jgi:hypothetical protein